MTINKEQSKEIIRVVKNAIAKVRDDVFDNEDADAYEAVDDVESAVLSAIRELRDNSAT